jgi:tetratricopeptide (TPR) repeat protein
MFILIPSLLIVLSLGGIGLIVYRKLPYLRKLSPEAHVVGDNLLYDFFPELISWFQKIPWHQYQQAILREVEKGLRRMRLAFLKIDHAAARLIQKVRHTHMTTQLEQQAVVQPEKILPDQLPAFDKPEPEDLKAREQQLIIEVAQDPKNPSLYEMLGDLYLKMESLQDAKEAYEAGLGFSPDNEALAHKYSALLKKIEELAG